MVEGGEGEWQILNVAFHSSRLLSCNAAMVVETIKQNPFETELELFLILSCHLDLAILILSFLMSFCTTSILHNNHRIRKRFDDIPSKSLVLCHPSSVISHQSSIINHQSSQEIAASHISLPFILGLGS